MKVNELVQHLNHIAPFHTAESWDNNGLLVGDKEAEVSSILISLDCHPEVIDEAIASGSNVIITHHPLIFSKLTSVTEDGIGKLIRKLIKKNINLISMHTNLDHMEQGVSHMIAEKLGLTDMKVMINHSFDYKKLRINVPEENVEDLKQCLAEVGVGAQGDYRECFYEYKVEGQFRPTADANPHIGTNEELEKVSEIVVEAIYENTIHEDVLKAIYEHHPYEEPAFDVLELNKSGDHGLGCIATGNFTLDELIKHIEEKSDRSVVNVVKGNSDPIRTIGIIGGSGMSYANEAFSRNIDVLITGDVKYHEAYDRKLMAQNIIDAGHYLEEAMIEGFSKVLSEELSVEVIPSKVNTNPFS